MVCRSPCRQNLEPQVVRDTNQVSVQLLLPFSGNEIPALLGAENAMYKICRVCVGHKISRLATLNLSEQQCASLITNTWENSTNGNVEVENNG